MHIIYIRVINIVYCNLPVTALLSTSLKVHYMYLLLSDTPAGKDLSHVAHLQWSLIRFNIQFLEMRISTSIISFFIHAFIVQLQFKCSLASTTQITGTFSFILKSCILLGFYYLNCSKFYFNRVNSLSINTQGVFHIQVIRYFVKLKKN